VVWFWYWFWYWIGFGAGMSIKKLSKIIAQELKNTYGVAPQYKERLTLVEAAYGEFEVEKDFLDWVDEVRNNPPQYPIALYLKIVDDRFRFAEESTTKGDPNVVRLSAQAFEKTGRTPSNRDVASALEKWPVDDVLAAFQRYIAGLDEKELKYAARNFYVYGGLDALMEITKTDKERAIPEAVVEQAMISSQTERTNAVSEKLAEIQKQKQFDDAHKDEI